jgi:opacity protein-like surface antigen
MTHNRTFSRGTKLPLLLAGASFAFALGATSLTASDAHAFTPEYELGAFGGVHLWNPQSGLGRFDEATTNNALHHGPAFGIRLGLGLHALFMLEGELALLPTSVNNQFKDPDGNPNTDQVLAFGYRLHGLFHILTGRVRPFLLVGGGGVSTSSSNPNIIQQQTTGSVDLGAGVKVNVRPNWGLRLDARADHRGVARLGEEVVGAAAEPRDERGAVVARGEQHDGGVAQRRVGLDAPAGLHPVHPGHHHVEHHAVGGARRERRERLLARARERHVAALRPQRRGERRQARRAVVHRQHAGPGGRAVTVVLALRDRRDGQ